MHVHKTQDNGNISR